MKKGGGGGVVGDGGGGTASLCRSEQANTQKTETLSICTNTAAATRSLARSGAILSFKERKSVAQ